MAAGTLNVVGEALSSFFNPTIPTQTPEKTSATPTNISPEERPSYLNQRQNTEQKEKSKKFAKQVIDDIWNSKPKTPNVAKQIHFSSPLPQEIPSAAAPPPQERAAPPPKTPTHIRFHDTPPPSAAPPPSTNTHIETGNPLAEEPRRITRSLFSSRRPNEISREITEKSLKAMREENERTLFKTIDESNIPRHEKVRIRMNTRLARSGWRERYGPPSNITELSQEHTFLTGHVNTEIRSLTHEQERSKSQKKKGKTPKK